MPDYLPKYVSNRGMIAFFVSLAVVNFIFMDNLSSIEFILIGTLEVVTFFYFGTMASMRWRVLSEKQFIKNLFSVALVLRIVVVTLLYFYYDEKTGIPFDYHAGDALFYDDIGHYGSYLIKNGNLFIYDELQKYSGGASRSDMGYPVMLSYIYFFVGDSILLSRYVKAILSAWMCVLIYKLAKRNFGEEAGRIAGVMAMLLPHFLYYCSSQLKESEMIFLTTLALERADALLREPRLKLKNVILPLFLALLLFYFRTVLGAAVLFSLGVAFVFSDNTVLSKHRRWQVAILAVLIALYATSGLIFNEMEGLYQKQQGGMQQSNYAWRAQTNSFAKYASGAVFAPMIFTLPFPTLAYVPGQEVQMMCSGNNFVKNIMSFFTIFAILMLILKKEWRGHLLIISFILAYLVILALSNFAHSERFHMPSLPAAVILMSYGITQLNNNNKWLFNAWSYLMVIAAVGWNFIKLKGRGMI